MKPKRIVAQRVHKEAKTSNRELWATVCYYFPQYSLKEASQLSVRDIKLLIKVANKIEAERYYNLVQIVASPHTQKGKGVKQLSEHFKRIMKE